MLRFMSLRRVGSVHNISITSHEWRNERPIKRENFFLLTIVTVMEQGGPMGWMLVCRKLVIHPLR